MQRIPSINRNGKRMDNVARGLGRSCLNRYN
jgi:hypothetical protein